MTSEYVSGSARILSTTTPLKLPAASRPPSNTTATAEKRHELSSGTILNSNVPASPGNDTETFSCFPLFPLDPDPDPDEALVVGMGEGAADPI